MAWVEVKPEELLGADSFKDVAEGEVSSPQAAALEFFKSTGWEPHQAAGIVGNLWLESGDMNPNAKEKGGSGRYLAQWTSKNRVDDLRNFTASKGEEVPSFRTQLEFVNWELANTEKVAGEALRSAKNPTEAAVLFSNLYERPGKPHLEKRIKYANDVYSMGQGGSGGLTEVQDDQIIPATDANTSVFSKLTGILSPSEAQAAEIPRQTKMYAVDPGPNDDFYEINFPQAAEKVGQQFKEGTVSVAIPWPKNKPLPPGVELVKKYDTGAQIPNAGMAEDVVIEPTSQPSATPQPDIAPLGPSDIGKMILDKITGAGQPEPDRSAENEFLKTQIAAGQSPEAAHQMIADETTGLEQATSPPELIVGGAGSIGKTLISKGGAILPSILRGALSGAVGTPAQLVIDPVAKGAAQLTHPALELPINLAMSLASGATIEQKAEKAIAKGAKLAAEKIPRELINPLLNERGAVQIGGPAVYKQKVVEDATQLLDDVRKAEPLSKYVDSINVSRISNEDDAKKVIGIISSQVQDHIKKQRRGKLTFDDIRNMAERTGLSEDQLMAKAPGQNWNAEKGLAARMLNSASAQNVTNKMRSVLKKNAEGTISDSDVIDFHRALERHRIIQAAESGIASEAGRALGARRIIVSPEMQAEKNLKDIVDALGGTDLTVEMAKRLATIDPTDTWAINRFIRDIHKATTFDKLYELWLNSLLSNPVTHTANTISNTLTYLGRAPEKTMAAGLDAVRSAMLGKPRERYFGEVASELFGFTEGLKRGMKVFAYQATTDTPVSIMEKVEHGTAAIKGMKGKVVRFPTRMLSAEDEFFKAINYTGELYALAFRQATKEGATGAAKAERISELIGKPTSKMMAKAVHDAAYRTFNQAAGPIGSQIMRLRNTDPTKMSKFVFPFLRTPINIAKYTLERTPLGFFHTAAKAIQGELKEGQAVDEMARAMLGTVVGTIAYTAADQGFITGSGPTDKAKKDAKYLTGWQPYSFYYNGKYHPYQRFEPLSSTIGMAADLAESWDEWHPDERGKMVAKIIKSVTTNITNKTYLQGLTAVTQAWSDPERYGNPWVEGLIASAVPGTVVGLSRGLDDTVRDTKRSGLSEEIMAKVKSRLPVLSETLPAKMDVLGEEIKRPGSFATRSLIPVAASERKDDPVRNELDRLKNHTAISPMSRKLEYKIGPSTFQVELTPEEYKDLSATIGEMVRPKLTQLVASPQYRSMNDETKAMQIRSIYDAIRSAHRTVAFWRFQKTDKSRIKKKKD